MGGRGSSGSRNAPTKGLEELKSERMALAEEYADFVNSHSDEEGVLTNEKDIRTMLDMQQKLNELEYNIFTQLSPTVSEKNWKGEGITDLTRDEAAVVRQDMLKNKEMYMAIASAAHGVSYGGTTDDTAVDSLYKSDPSKVYRIFASTRDMLKKKYGDTITLYRVPTSQTSKATINMTSTRQNANQYAELYGGKVRTFKVPVKDVLAVNIRRGGTYEEFIILNKGKK